ncbi:MAG: TraR/DksA C4-type zinc finger protein [Nitrospirae bacterium]|nr:TraR/DksA C4-type zinc finger protein [Nitrospirota bacterium]
MALKKQPGAKQANRKTSAPAPAKKTVAKKPPVSGKKNQTVKPVSGPDAKTAPKQISGKSPEVRTAPLKQKETQKKGSSSPQNKVRNVIKNMPPERDRMQDLKTALLKKKEAIVKEAKDEIAKYVSGENRQLVDTAVDEGDWATVDISEDINLMRLDAHRRLMLEIDEALRKIREGTYGICEECGEEISEKRLNVMPAATLCISCKENREQLEAVAKEETD